MRNLLLSVVAFYTLICACCRDDLHNYPHMDFHEELSDIIVANQSNIVGEDDVRRYLSSRMKTKGETADISVITGSDGDTLLYAVQYADGWEILSSDKRVPSVVAFSEYGTINAVSSAIGFIDWLDQTKASMSAIKNSSDDLLQFTPSEITENKQFWNVDLYGEGYDPDSLGLVQLPFVRGGHWEVQSVTYGRETYEKVNHQMITYWYQGHPYDLRCGYNEDGEQYSLGCGAVAVGQLYYFLRRRDNPSDYLYNTVPLLSLRTNTPDDYDNPTVVAVADYLYYVANELHTHFGTAGSWVSPDKVSDFFEARNYSCNRGFYDADSVKVSLVRGNPVLMLALPSIAESGLYNSLRDSHYFVIDGYWSLWNVKTTTYRFVRDDPTKPIPVFFDEIYTDVEYINVMNLYVKMNWGWKDQWESAHINDGWYSYTGDWIVDEDDSPSNYNTCRYMFIVR